MMFLYLYPEDVDRRLSWPLGRAERLARQRRLPYVLLPDGSIRLKWEERGWGVLTLITLLALPENSWVN